MMAYVVGLCSALVVHGYVSVVQTGGRQLVRHAAVTAIESSENDGYRREPRQGGDSRRAGGYGGGGGDGSRYDNGYGGSGSRERRVGSYGGGDGSRYGGGGGSRYDDGYGGGGSRERRAGGYGSGDGSPYGGDSFRGRRSGGSGDGYRGGGGGGVGYREQYGGRGGAGSRERRDVRRQDQGANVKPGDWTCPTCGANVFASKTRCFKCQTLNPDPEARAAAATRSAARGTPPWHPDAPRRGAGGDMWEWQGLDGCEDFEASLADDEAAFRAKFGPAHSSGIDFASYAEIPVETELPRSMPQLSPETLPVEHFDGLDCGRVLRRNLRFAGFEVPTPVQAHSIPVALGGIDIISVAQTGSGKTLAFMLPILKRLLQSGSQRGTPGYGGDYRRGRGEPVAIRALVLAPTRELAQQIHAEADKFAFRTGLRICVAYGGTPFGSQMRELERGCDVLVATPGRVNDMVLRERVSLRNVRFLVLDEADRMLDMGFEPQIRSLVEGADMPRGGRGSSGEEEEDGGGGGGGDDGGRRQTVMFSATFPRAVRAIADSFLVDPLMLKVGRVGGAASSVTQKVVYVERRDKTRRAIEMLQTVPGKTIIFVNTKRAADMLEEELCDAGHPAASVHGDRDQRQRERALGDFKSGRIEVIVGTDVLGRGIDVPEVTHVINYDVPDDIEDYTHRIGRTGRAGHEGLATSMITSGNGNIARDLLHMLTTSKQEAPEWLEAMVPQKRGGGGRRGSGRRGRGRGGRGGGGGGGGRGRYGGGGGGGGYRGP